jgi:hypothetical protein
LHLIRSKAGKRGVRRPTHEKQFRESAAEPVYS